MEPASEKAGAGTGGRSDPVPATHMARPELTRGQRFAGRILCVSGYLAMLVGGFFWVGSIIAAVWLFSAAEAVDYLELLLAILIAVSFVVTGRGASLLGEVFTGKAPPVGAPLLLKKLVRDLIFEVTGLLFLPLLLAGVSLLLIGGKTAGWSVLAGALAIGFGLPRALKAAVRNYSEP